jgi:hypothetical protein
LPPSIGKFGSQDFSCLAESYNNCIILFHNFFD